MARWGRKRRIESNTALSLSERTEPKAGPLPSDAVERPISGSHPVTDFEKLIDVPGGLRARQFSRDQWGRAAIETLERDPTAFRVVESPHARFPWNNAMFGALGKLEGLRVLHLGCATGQLSVFMAQRGAAVVGVEPSALAVDAARRIARRNGVECEFRVGHPDEVTLGAASFDRVFSTSLHHLARPDLQRALDLSASALCKGGRAVFCEGIEDDRTFSFLQNLVPLSRGNPARRPSILQRNAWRAWQARVEERDLESREFIDTPRFAKVELTGFGLFSRFDRLLQERRARATLRRIDGALLGRWPGLRRFAQVLLVVATK
jgi:SAM-dependent methyltransferase